MYLSSSDVESGMFPRCKNTSSNQSVPSRRGFVLVAVVVVLTISLALFGVWARAAVQQHRRSRNEALRLQAIRLAEAGLRRAMVRRAAESAYNGETWRVDGSELASVHAGEVRIRVEPSTDIAGLRFEATAEFPVGVAQRAQITKRMEIPNTASEGDR
jgi:Tfp pilus assembly protein PilX